MLIFFTILEHCDCDKLCAQTLLFMERLFDDNSANLTFFYDAHKECKYFRVRDCNAMNIDESQNVTEFAPIPSFKSDPTKFTKHLALASIAKMRIFMLTRTDVWNSWASPRRLSYSDPHVLSRTVLQKLTAIRCNANNLLILVTTTNILRRWTTSILTVNGSKTIRLHLQTDAISQCCNKSKAKMANTSTTSFNLIHCTSLHLQRASNWAVR